MRSLLDQIIDRVQAGDPPLVLFAADPCENPTVLPIPSYNLGCRCLRCRLGHQAARQGRPRYTSRPNWRTP